MTYLLALVPTQPTSFHPYLVYPVKFVHSKETSCRDVMAARPINYVQLN
jgi:hypothetical protein